MKLIEMTMQSRLIASLRKVARANDRLAAAVERHNDMAFPAEAPKSKRERKPAIITGSPKKRDDDDAA